MATASRHRRSRIWRRRGLRALTAFTAVIVVGLGAHLLGAQGQTRAPSVAAPAIHTAGPADAVALGALCPSAATGQGATAVPVALSPQVCVSAAPAVVPEAGLPLLLSASGTTVLFGAVMLSTRRSRHRGPAPTPGLG